MRYACKILSLQGKDHLHLDVVVGIIKILISKFGVSVCVCVSYSIVVQDRDRWGGALLLI